MSGKNSKIPKEIMDIIESHALGAAASGLGTAWLPGVGSIAAMASMVGFIWSMYFRINKQLGVDMSAAKLKTLASAVLSNLMQSACSIAGGMVLSGVLSMTGLGSVAASVIMAGMNYAIVKVGGQMYMKLIGFMTGSGRRMEKLTEQELTEQMTSVMGEENLGAMLKQSRREYAEGRKSGSFTGKEKVVLCDTER